MNLRYFCELLFLAALWGASFLFIRIGSPEFGPLALMMLRCMIAGLVLLPIMLCSKHRLLLFRHAGPITVVGILGTAIPFALYGFAALSLNAGVISVLNATTAMFTAIIAYVWLKEDITLVSILGLVIGFLGVAFLIIDNAQENNAGVLTVFAALVASCCYAAGANYTRRYLTGVNYLIITGGSQLVAACVLLPLGMIYWPDSPPSREAYVALFILSVFCTALALTIFFRLIDQLGVFKTMTVTYLIPVFGLFWGSLFLDEIITLNIVIGGFMVLFGVALINGIFSSLSFKGSH